MCEPTKPIDKLESLKFSVAALTEMYPRGSFDRENAKNAARGIEAQIDWVIRQLKAAGEGTKNMGA